MRTLAFTPSARSARDRYDVLIEKYPEGPLGLTTRSFLRATLRSLDRALCFGIALEILVLGAVLSEGLPLILSVYLIGLIPLVGTVLYKLRKLGPVVVYWWVKRRYHTLLKRGELLEVGDYLYGCWSKCRAAAGLSSFEPRADLDNFPEIAQKVSALLLLRNNALTTQEEKGLIDNKIDQLMNEALSALAATIKEAEGHARLIQETEHSSNRMLLARQIETLLNS